MIRWRARHVPLSHEGLGDCVGAFRSAGIDGNALLRLRPDNLGETLRIPDEQTEFRICAALSPLKQKTKKGGGGGGGGGFFSSSTATTRTSSRTSCG